MASILSHLGVTSVDVYNVAIIHALQEYAVVWGSVHAILSYEDRRWSCIEYSIHIRGCLFNHRQLRFCVRTLREVITECWENREVLKIFTLLCLCIFLTQFTRNKWFYNTKKKGTLYLRHIRKPCWLKTGGPSWAWGVWVGTPVYSPLPQLTLHHLLPLICKAGSTQVLGWQHLPLIPFLIDHEWMLWVRCRKWAFNFVYTVERTFNIILIHCAN